MKYPILTILITTLGVFYACGNPEPVETMKWEENKMVDILFDLRIMDNQVKKHHVLDRDSVSLLYKNIILNAHNTNEEELIYHLKIMQNDEKLSKRLEDKVLKIMVARKKEFEKDDEYN